MTVGKYTYSLSKEFDGGLNPYVAATKFYNPQNAEELKALKERGWKTFDGFPAVGTHPASPALAWKRIPLAEVPASNETDWETWDEY